MTFIFIDGDLNSHAPGSTPPGSITIQADNNQHIWHYLLLLESSPWPSAKCDAHPDW